MVFSPFIQILGFLSQSFSLMRFVPKRAALYMLVLIVMASIATIWFWVRIWTKPEFAIETILVPMPRSAVPSMEKNSDTGSQAVLPSIEKLPETESQLVVPTHSANQAHTVGATNADPPPQVRQPKVC